jgi:hypothetical protein
MSWDEIVSCGGRQVNDFCSIPVVRSGLMKVMDKCMLAIQGISFDLCHHMKYETAQKACLQCKAIEIGRKLHWLQTNWSSKLASVRDFVNQARLEISRNLFNPLISYQVNTVYSIFTENSETKRLDLFEAQAIIDSYASDGETWIQRIFNELNRQGDLSVIVETEEEISEGEEEKLFHLPRRFQPRPTKRAVKRKKIGAKSIKTAKEAPAETVNSIKSKDSVDLSTEEHKSLKRVQQDLYRSALDEQIAGKKSISKENSDRKETFTEVPLLHGKASQEDKDKVIEEILAEEKEKEKFEWKLKRRSSDRNQETKDIGEFKFYYPQYNEDDFEIASVVLSRIWGSQEGGSISDIGSEQEDRSGPQEEGSPKLVDTLPVKSQILETHAIMDTFIESESQSSTDSSDGEAEGEDFKPRWIPPSLNKRMKDSSDGKVVGLKNEASGLSPLQIFRLCEVLTAFFDRPSRTIRAEFAKALGIPLSNSTRQVISFELVDFARENMEDFIGPNLTLLVFSVFFNQQVNLKPFKSSFKLRKFAAAWCSWIKFYSKEDSESDEILKKLFLELFKKFMEFGPSKINCELHAIFETLGIRKFHYGGLCELGVLLDWNI